MASACSGFIVERVPSIIALHCTVATKTQNRTPYSHYDDGFEADVDDDDAYYFAAHVIVCDSTFVAANKARLLTPLTTD